MGVGSQNFAAPILIKGGVNYDKIPRLALGSLRSSVSLAWILTSSILLYLSENLCLWGWAGKVRQNLSRLQREWVVLGRGCVATAPAPLHHVLTYLLGPSSPDLRLQKPQKLRGGTDSWDMRTHTLPILPSSPPAHFLLGPT